MNAAVLAAVANARGAGPGVLLYALGTLTVLCGVAAFALWRWSKRNPIQPLTGPGRVDVFGNPIAHSPQERG